MSSLKFRRGIPEGYSDLKPRLLLRTETDLGPLEPGRYLKLVRVRAGTHSWTEIHAPHYDRGLHRILKNDKRWWFHVKPEAVNYVGRIVVSAGRGSDYADVRLLNRTAMSLPDLRAQFGPYLERYPLVYSGAARDDFLDAYRQVSTDKGRADVD